MRYLKDFIENEQNKLFEQTGAFFAFNQEQFNKLRIEGMQYVQVGRGTGLVCPLHQEQILKKRLAALHSGGMQKYVKGMKKNIK